MQTNNKQRKTIRMDRERDSCREGGREKEGVGARERKGREGNVSPVQPEYIFFRGTEDKTEVEENKGGAREK